MFSLKIPLIHITKLQNETIFDKKFILFIMNNLFSSLFDCVKKRIALFILLCIATIGVIVLAVFSAISFDSSALSIDLSNIAYMRFLSGDSNFAMLIFISILNIAIIYALILVFSCKKYLLPLALIVYLYFVYTQTVVFVCILLIYGLFNTLLLLIVLLIYLLAEFIFLTLIIIMLSTMSGCQNYFSECFSNKAFLLASLMLIAIILVFCLVLAMLKSFIILLIF